MGNIKLEDILLPESTIFSIELEVSLKEHIKGETWEQSDSIGRRESAKAQCRRVLYILEQLCSNPLHNLDGDFTHKKLECLECWEEIKVLLN